MCVGACLCMQSTYENYENYVLNLALRVGTSFTV